LQFREHATHEGQEVEVVFDAMHAVVAQTLLAAGKKKRLFGPLSMPKNHQFTQTGSGQTEGTLPKRLLCFLRDRAGISQEVGAAGAKNATFCAIYILKRTFYQDRLGTNIGKPQKRVAFCAGAGAPGAAAALLAALLPSAGCGYYL
jgi:hypothetical protein